jgi:hypothetical protein
VGWICRGGLAPGRPRNLSPARDWARGGPIPPGCAQPVTGRGVGQLAPGAWACAGLPCPGVHTHSQEEENQIFWKRFLPPSGRSAGLAPPPQKASISICSSELVLSLGTLHLLLGPLLKFSLNVGARHCGRMYIEPVCLRHPHTANSISLTRTCTHYCHELGGE